VLVINLKIKKVIRVDMIVDLIEPKNIWRRKQKFKLLRIKKNQEENHLVILLKFKEQEITYKGETIFSKFTKDRFPNENDLDDIVDIVKKLEIKNF
jgi:hypothetical protein